MTPPLDHPVVKIGERTYTLKYSLLAKYHLSRQGISESELLKALSEFLKATVDALSSVPEGTDIKNIRVPFPARWLAAVIDAFSACVAHMYTGPEQPPTSDQWARTLESEFENNPQLPMELFQQLQRAILKAPRPSVPAPTLAAGETAKALN